MLNWLLNVTTITTSFFMLASGQSKGGGGCLTITITSLLNAVLQLIIVGSRVCTDHVNTTHCRHIYFKLTIVWTLHVGKNSSYKRYKRLLNIMHDLWLKKCVQVFVIVM